jgi:hypothetical protein
MEQSTLLKIKEHQQLAAFHNNEATRLINESLEDVSTSSTRKGKLSQAFRERIIAKARRVKR